MTGIVKTGLPTAVLEMAAEHRLWEAEQVALGKCCGSCELFTDEDMSGNGWCQFRDGGTSCGETCRHWTANAKPTT